jgi:hypothetical protein
MLAVNRRVSAVNFIGFDPLVVEGVFDTIIRIAYRYEVPENYKDISRV